MLVVGVCQGQTIRHYCEARCYWMFKGDYTLQLDLGDVKDPYANGGKCEVVDSVGKSLRFPTCIAALNWLSQRGWLLSEFKEHTNSPYATYYILYKDCTEDKVKEGIKLAWEIKNK